VVDEEIMFETLELSFPFWEEPGDGDGDPAGEEGGATGEDGGNDEHGGSETGDAGPGGLGEDDGCNCSTGSSGPASRGLGKSLLGLLALLGLRRRRRYCGEIPQPSTSDGMQPTQLQRKSSRITVVS
jgi:MYXO-CTERM domain-containing protein